MKTYKTKGYINGISAAVSYGTNPLFALPLYSGGYSVNSVLFYRYLFAVILYGFWLKFFKNISFKISLKEFCMLFIFGIIFSFSSLFLFDAFRYIDSGLACTILFAYPIIVALISKIVFKENLAKIIWFALFLVVYGIILLYNGNPDGSINIKGVTLVLLSALSYAIYIVGVRHINIIKHIKPDKLTFYIMLFGLSVYIWNLRFCQDLQILTNWFYLACTLGLAVFPTIISIETITFAIKFIGATKTAIIGALEPLTALFFGILLFGEPISLKIIFGITLILFGVILVILKKH